MSIIAVQERIEVQFGQGKHSMCNRVSREKLEEKAGHLPILSQHPLLCLFYCFEPGICRLTQLHLPQRSDERPIKTIISERERSQMQRPHDSRASCRRTLRQLRNMGISPFCGIRAFAHILSLPAYFLDLLILTKASLCC